MRLQLCGGLRAKEIGVAVKYMPGVSVGFEFFGLQLHIEELFGCGILLTHIDGSYPPRMAGDYRRSLKGRRICRIIEIDRRVSKT